MTPRTARLKQNILDKHHHDFRRDVELTFTPEELAVSTLDEWESIVLEKKCRAEKPVILTEENILFTRSVGHFKYDCLPAVLSGKRFGMFPANICADWERALSKGLLGLRDEAEASMTRYCRDATAQNFLCSAIRSIDAVLELASRYAEAAEAAGRSDLAIIIRHVPGKSPRSLHEALQSLKFMHSCLFLFSNHVGLGRFDQYILPYYRHDIEHNIFTETEAEELIQEFFISLNKDTDLYPGVQPGDNGQSLVLGGVDRSGKPVVNELTMLCMRASREVNMIDPKINLRIDKNTPHELLREAVKLTRRGLGFPQYCNDDVVIPALVKHGYSLEDARDYTVAACWEFIIPGRGMDVPNINGLAFPAAVDQAIRAKIGRGCFEELERAVATNIRTQVEDYIRLQKTDDFCPQPFYSVLMTSCLERGKDINHGGCDYYNYGIHGCGSANAADALAAVKQLVYDEKSVTPGELLDALWKNWEGHEDLRKHIMGSHLKVGNHSKLADEMLVKLFGWFADACESVGDNGRGGIIRPGTGTAMFYIYLADPNWTGSEPTVGATADGRKVGDFFASSLAPSPGAEVAGIIGVLQSFSQIDYSRICNGGPITVELSDTVFRNEEDLDKVAALISTFANIGCQQLQMNVLDTAVLEEARKHPELYRNLIVRVWGWSGYFVELAPKYQQHIINRNTYRL
ncbi:MAG: hypothetical protein JXR78_05625 [Victivallales bacterium]|nr:hypothetical protein [Victivallales bacterium]